MRHRVDTELTEADPFQLTIGGVILDVLHIIAEAVARMKHRWMAIGKARAIVEMVARQRAEAIEVRLDVAENVLRQMDAQQIHERWICTKEIEPRGVGRNGAGRELRFRDCHVRSTPK